MDLKDNCIILLDKGTQKVKCFKFMNKKLKRDLALHENSDNKDYSSVSDVNTGLRLFDISIKVKNVKETDIEEKIDWFIKHYGLDTIQTRFREKEEIPLQEKINAGKKK